MQDCNCTPGAPQRQLIGSVAAEQTKGDLTDDPVPGKGFRKYTHHQADHCGAAIEELCSLETFATDLRCSSALEPVVVGGRRSHLLLKSFEMLSLA